jgi:hypothetical protein
MRQHFANQVIKAGLAGLAAAIALSGVALAGGIGDLKNGHSQKLVPTKIQLGITSPAENICPGNGKLTAWVQSNKPGTINIMIVKQGGNVAGPYAVNTVKGANGIIMGSYTQNLIINNPVDAKYRVVVAGTDVVSNWAPLVAEC